MTDRPAFEEQQSADDLASKWERQRRYRERRRAAGFRITQPDLAQVMGAEERLYSKAKKVRECLEWTGPRSPKGYGSIGIGTANMRTHRASWMIANAQEVPPGMLVLHRCDNPPCIRPDHLFLGTPRDNMEDMHRKARHPNDRYDFSNFARGERHGSAKLNRRAVEDIRFLAAIGWKQRDLAKEFGVTQRAIWQVIHRKTWAHV